MIIHRFVIPLVERATDADWTHGWQTLLSKKSTRNCRSTGLGMDLFILRSRIAGDAWKETSTQANGRRACREGQGMGEATARLAEVQSVQQSCQRWRGAENAHENFLTLWSLPRWIHQGSMPPLRKDDFERGMARRVAMLQRSKGSSQEPQSLPEAQGWCGGCWGAEAVSLQPSRNYCTVSTCL